jgi:hypothetical protein
MSVKILSPKKSEICKDAVNQKRNEKILELVKEIAESGEDIQENYTPPEICDMLLEKIDLKGNKSILILYNVEIIFSLYKSKYQGQITFLTSSQRKVDFSKKLFGGIKIEYIEESEDPLKRLEEMKKWPGKFDIIVSNPPYSKYLHVKFLEKSLDLANEKVLFVHPSNQFINTKGGNSTYVNSNKLIEDKLESVTLFNGNKIFGIAIKAPCSITELNPSGNAGIIKVNNMMENETYLVKSISEITQFKNKPELWSLKSKIDSYVLDNGSLDSILGKKCSGDFMVEFSRIRGHCDNEGGMDSIMPKDNFYTFVDKNFQTERKSNPKYDLWFKFKTEINANNFLNYLKTDFARFSLAMYKYAQSLNNGELRFVPLMDFTQEWTDEKLYSHFNITEEEQAYIKEIIPPYYD